MTNPPYLPIFELTRGTIVESIHYGAIAVMDSSGCLIASYGNPQTTTYLRSSAKPFQALPFIEQGGQELYGLSQAEIALICASHTGTDEHLEVLVRLQQKTGVSEADLLCGIHPPIDRQAEQALRERGEKPTPNRHNCSGKHTGMLAFARMLGAPTQNYLDPEHPVQQAILQALAEMSGLRVDEIFVGIDGCSAPNFAVPLSNAALAVARLCDPEHAQPALAATRKVACHKIFQAMTTYPVMVGGPTSFDTHLMSTAQGSVVSKGGAEGYQILGILPGAIAPDSPALGIAIKISDGDLKSHSRAVGDARGQVRPAVALETLRQLGALSPQMLASLSEYGPSFPLHNWRKLLVGEARPRFQLEFQQQQHPAAGALPKK